MEPGQRRACPKWRTKSRLCPEAHPLGCHDKLAPNEPQPRLEGASLYRAMARQQARPTSRGNAGVPSMTRRCVCTGVATSPKRIKAEAE
jgi:hypothetical protein